MLPGVAQLALVARELARRDGREVWLAALRGVRFRRAVGPAEALAVNLAEGGEAETRFDLRVGEERVSEGVVRAGDVPASLEIAPGEAPPPVGPEIERLIPHRGPALLLRRLLETDSGALAALAAVPGDSPFARGGGVPAFLAIEMAAQAAGALEALVRQEGGPRRGYLVGVREAALLQPWIPVETPLHVEVRPAGGVSALAVYGFEVEASGVACASGTISAYLP